MTSIFLKLNWNYIRNNIQSVVFLWLLIVFNLILFIYRAYEYRQSGWLVMMARSNGQCLNFMCAFIIVCVLRKSITKLRSIGLSEFLPLDHYVYFHKLMGWLIVFYSIFHTVMHVMNFRYLSQTTPISWSQYLFSTRLGIGWIGGAACLTGWLLLIILMVMMIPAQPFMRRSGYFEVFYYSHLLYIPFYICLFIHGPKFWKWFLCPLIVFVSEWITRITKTWSGDRGLTYIEQGVVLPSRVIQLIVKRPVNFYFRPGDYIYVQIPTITPYEWHPLTISSAPEQSDILWLHIRAVGEWTNRLHNYFNTEGTIKASLILEKRISQISTRSSIENSSNRIVDDNDDTNHSPLRRTKSSITLNTRQTQSLNNLYMNAKVMVLPVPVDCNEFGCGKLALIERKKKDIEMAASPINKVSFRSLTKLRSSPTKDIILKNAIILDKPLKVRLDGPYGSPSSHIFHTQHAILIATGIGVTPFASILQSIMLRYIEAKRDCPKCAHSWSDPIPPNVMKLKKVDFMWINRDQTSFEWFVTLLSELEKQQEEWRETERFLDIHMHITQGTYQQRRSSIQVTGPISNETQDMRAALTWHKGRPDWNKFFKNMADKKKGRITVFFCGRPDLARSLRHICTQFGFQFRKEIF
ncbi:NADPH oxidase 5-like [Oppia nitens]|uniref:NADPH oxidase 5-like n=1 Tax=Oppia nitens TaxID=1686743 RepID=UPI0023DA769D|nr:NADPH oxidase 5-like [Oppia nitens]